MCVEEGLDGWSFVKPDEVTAALQDLTVLGGFRRPPSAQSSTVTPAPRREQLPEGTPAPAATVVAAAAVTEEDEVESSTTEGEEANRMLSRADTLEPVFSAGEDEWGEEASADPMENLSLVIGNLLNNPVVVGAIQSELVRDPNFYALMRQVNPALPCASRPLLITELGSEDGGWSATSSTSFDLSDQWDKDGGEVGAPTPLVTLLHGIQRGVGRLALRVGEAFAHLGNFLRRLGDNLKTSLDGMHHVETAAENAREAAEGAARNWEKAVVKVACAVAVVIIAKRVRAFT